MSTPKGVFFQFFPFRDFFQHGIVVLCAVSCSAVAFCTASFVVSSFLDSKIRLYTGNVFPLSSSRERSSVLVYSLLTPTSSSVSARLIKWFVLCFNPFLIIESLPIRFATTFSSVDAFFEVVARSGSFSSGTGCFVSPSPSAWSASSEALIHAFDETRSIFRTFALLISSSSCCLDN